MEKISGGPNVQNKAKRRGVASRLTQNSHTDKKAINKLNLV